MQLPAWLTGRTGGVENKQSGSSAFISSRLKVLIARLLNQVDTTTGRIRFVVRVVDAYQSIFRQYASIYHHMLYAGDVPVFSASSTFSSTGYCARRTFVGVITSRELESIMRPAAASGEATPRNPPEMHRAENAGAIEHHPTGFRHHRHINRHHITF